MEGGTIRVCFPHIYAMVQQKDIKVCDSLVENYSSEKELQAIVLRNLNDWEIGECEELLGMLSNITLARSIDIP